VAQQIQSETLFSLAAVAKPGQELLSEARHLPEALNAILATGYSCLGVDANGDTALHHLARDGKKHGYSQQIRESLRLLVEAGVPLSWHNSRGESALGHMIDAEQQVLVQELTERAQARLQQQVYLRYPPAKRPRAFTVQVRQMESVQIRWRMMHDETWRQKNLHGPINSLLNQIDQHFLRECILPDILGSTHTAWRPIRRDSSPNALDDIRVFCRAGELYLAYPDSSTGLWTEEPYTDWRLGRVEERIGQLRSHLVARFERFLDRVNRDFSSLLEAPPSSPLSLELDALSRRLCLRWFNPLDMRYESQILNSNCSDALRHAVQEIRERQHVLDALQPLGPRYELSFLRDPGLVDTWLKPERIALTQSEDGFTLHWLSNAPHVIHALPLGSYPEHGEVKTLIQKRERHSFASKMSGIYDRDGGAPIHVRWLSEKSCFRLHSRHPLLFGQDDVQDCPGRSLENLEACQERILRLREAVQHYQALQEEESVPLQLFLHRSPHSEDFLYLPPHCIAVELDPQRRFFILSKFEVRRQAIQKHASQGLSDLSVALRFILERHL
jgi:hypothetical protein